MVVLAIIGMVTVVVGLAFAIAQMRVLAVRGAAARAQRAVEDAQERLHEVENLTDDTYVIYREMVENLREVLDEDENDVPFLTESQRAVIRRVTADKREER